MYLPLPTTFPFSVSASDEIREELSGGSVLKTIFIGGIYCVGSCNSS